MKDLIDRNAVIKIINDELEYSDNVYATSVCITIRRAVNVLPSAQAELAQNLHTTCTDAISRQAAIEAIHEDADWLAAQGSDWQVERMERDKSILKSLPSTEPERKKGKWIVDSEKYEAITCVCSICGRNMTTPKRDRASYCWNCGADMREGDSDEQETTQTQL